MSRFYSTDVPLLPDAPLKATNDLSFSEALRALKTGGRVARTGWNGKGMWLILIGPGDWQVENVDLHGPDDLGGGLRPTGWIGQKTADGAFVPWLCSQIDMLAEDWVLVE